MEMRQAADACRFCQEWRGFNSYSCMWPFLRGESHFVANVQAWQTGKIFNGMFKLLYLDFRFPDSLILVTAPKFNQVKSIILRLSTNTFEG